MPAPPVLPPDASAPSVPLYSQAIIRNHEGKMFIWADGEATETRPDVRPSVWSVTPDGRVAETREMRRLSDTSAPPSTWYRLEFSTHHKVVDYFREKERQGQRSYVGNYDRWDVRILVEDPEFFSQFSHTRQLRLLTVDIEQRSEGGIFPDRSDPIVSIAIGYGDGAEPEVTVSVDDGSGEPNDAACIEAWKRALEEFDPDIIAAFNAPYDLGVLAARAAEHGYPLDDWGRMMPIGERAQSRILEKDGRYDVKTPEAVWIGGRVVWDVYKNAKQDYSLSGVKDHKLKTIAEFLELPALEEDTSNTLAVWKERPEDLARYNANDVVILEHLCGRYLHDRIKLAEFYGAPIGMCLEAPGGWGGTIASARSLWEEGIVADGRNADRHSEYLKPKPKGGFMKFAGAHVAIHKRGVFPDVYKADYASLYPNILIAAGSGPDNTRIVGTEEFGEFSSWRANGKLCFSIPDANYNHNWLIEVEGRSKFSDVYLRERMEDRLKAKEAGDKARADILKTLLNAMFGVHGALFNKYGVMPIAIICTGVGRLLVQKLEEMAGDAAIETDTDGVYMDREPNATLFEAAANQVAGEHGLEKRFTVDIDEYDAGYFHQAKTYLVLEDGKMKRYGVAFKGRSHPAIFDQVIERVGTALMRDGREAALAEARRCLDFANYDPSDFVQRTRLNKPLHEYKHKCMQVKVALAHKEALGTPPAVGRSYEYVRTREGMVPPTPENLSNLDEYAYLSRVILPALSRLGFEDPEELGIESRLNHTKARSKRPAGESTLSSFS